MLPVRCYYSSSGELNTSLQTKFWCRQIIYHIHVLNQFTKMHSSAKLPVTFYRLWASDKYKDA